MLVLFAVTVSVIAGSKCHNLDLQLLDSDLDAHRGNGYFDVCTAYRHKQRAWRGLRYARKYISKGFTSLR